MLILKQRWEPFLMKQSVTLTLKGFCSTVCVWDEVTYFTVIFMVDMWQEIESSLCVYVECEWLCIQYNLPCSYKSVALWLWKKTPPAGWCQQLQLVCIFLCIIYLCVGMYYVCVFECVCITYSAVISVVVAWEDVEGPQLMPASAQFLSSVAVEATDVTSC